MTSISMKFMLNIYLTISVKAEFIIQQSLLRSAVIDFTIFSVMKNVYPNWG